MDSKMNERIRELMDQAGWINAYTNPKDGFEPVFEGEDRNLACIEKFAELIVRECARVYWNIDDSEIHGEYVKALKKHFGVES